MIIVVCYARGPCHVNGSRKSGKGVSTHVEVESVCFVVKAHSPVLAVFRPPLPVFRASVNGEPLPIVNCVNRGTPSRCDRPNQGIHQLVTHVLPIADRP